jgi:hypothetical protein
MENPPQSTSTHKDNQKPTQSAPAIGSTAAKTIATTPQQARKEPTSSPTSLASSPGPNVISTSPPQRTPSQSSLHKVHRQSFVENLRNVPPSPRSQRHPSFTGVHPSAIADLLSLPPTHKMPDPRFAGRDWRDITIGELVAPEDVKWVTMNTSVEDATKVRGKARFRHVFAARSPLGRGHSQSDTGFSSSFLLRTAPQTWS